MRIDSSAFDFGRFIFVQNAFDLKRAKRVSLLGTRDFSDGKFLCEETPNSLDDSVR